MWHRDGERRPDTLVPLRRMMLLRRKGPGVAIQDSARVRPFPVREGTVILRGAIVFLGLMLLLCAAARAEKRVAQEVLVFPAAPTVGQSL